MIPVPYSTLFIAAFRFADICVKLHAAPEETKVFCRLIQRVRSDRAEALRERLERARVLEDLPKKRKWIDETIQDTTEALQTIGSLVEGARIDVARGKKVGYWHRLAWVVAKKDDFLAKQSLLATCHQSLSLVIMFLHSLQEGPMISSLRPPPAYEDAGPTLRSPAARKPQVKQSFVLPGSGVEASDLTDEWERSLKDSEWTIELSSPELHALEHEGITDEAPWDEVSRDDAACIAIPAISDLGCNNKSTSTIAEPLRQPADRSERRKRSSLREVHFQTPEVEAREQPARAEQPSLLNTNERRLRRAAHFPSDGD